MSKPKPIVDPTHGQYQVVISFRLEAPMGPRTATEHFYGLFPALICQGWKFADLDVAVREIGAGGETGADEGRYDRPANMAVPGHTAAPKRRSGAKT